MTKTSSSPPSVRSAKINHADDSSPPRASHFRTLRFRPRRDHQLPRPGLRDCSVAHCQGVVRQRRDQKCYRSPWEKPTKIDDPASL